MTYYPIKKTRNAAIFTLVCFVLTAGLYTIGQLGFGYRMLFQLAALIALSAGIMMVSRYVLTDYKYVISDIDSRDGSMSFGIVRVTGKREVEMGHFDMTSIYACGRERSLGEFERKHGKVDKVYNYTSSYRSGEQYRLAIEFNGKKIMFLIDASQAFEAEIEKRIRPEV